MFFGAHYLAQTEIENLKKKTDVPVLVMVGVLLLPGFSNHSVPLSGEGEKLG